MPKFPAWAVPDPARAQQGGPRVLTVEHFVTTSFNKPVQSAVDTLEEGEALLDVVQSQYVPKLVSGVQLFSHLKHKTRLLPSGCDSIDDLLRGGLREGQHTELVGESAVGKTQLCLLAALTTAVRLEHVVYIDTTNSFSPGRLAAMYAHLQRKHLQQTDTQSVFAPLEQALDHITVYKAFHVHALLRALDNLSVTVAQAETGSRPMACLIIVDSISAVITPVLGGIPQGEGHALMAAVGRLLKHLALRFTLAVLSTNHSVGGEGESKPALGESWRNQPHVRLQLYIEERNARRATLKACAITPVEQSAWYLLAEAGPVGCAPPS